MEWRCGEGGFWGGVKAWDGGGLGGLGRGWWEGREGGVWVGRGEDERGIWMYTLGVTSAIYVLLRYVRGLGGSFIRERRGRESRGITCFTTWS